MSDELKPCPFCGEAVEMHDYTDKPACAWVMIHRCKAVGPIKLESYSGVPCATGGTPAPSPRRTRDE